MSSLPTVCFLSAHLPSSDSKEAGQRVAYQHLEYLSNSFDVLLLSFANKRELENIDPKLYVLCSEVNIFSINTPIRIFNLLKSFWLPIYISIRCDSRIRKKLLEIESSFEDLYLWAEYSQMSYYLNLPSTRKLQSVLVVHDVITQLFERKLDNTHVLLKVFYSFEIWRTEKWETISFQAINKILALSNKDKEILIEHLDNKRAYVDILYPKVNNLCKTKKFDITSNSPEILFFGAMNRYENEHGIKWFINNVWPSLRLSLPTCKLNIVGARPSESLHKFCEGLDGVEIFGFVEDPSKLFSQAWLSIAPIQLGAGVKLKVLELLSYGVPVVATTIGGEGITATENDGLLIYDELEQFTSACISLLSNKMLCEKLGKSARMWFNNVYKSLEVNEHRVKSLMINNVTTKDD